MKRQSIQIITTQCRRCGKPLATLNRSLYGNDQLKQQLDRVCGGCITKEETNLILDETAKAILKTGR